MQSVKFTKYHGLGNDFIILPEAAVKGSLGAFAQRLCDRHTGLGADGLITVADGPLRMRIINADGSEAPMCGNGIRCFAKYLLDEGITASDEFEVDTSAGLQQIRVKSREPFLCEVGLGQCQETEAELTLSIEDGEYDSTTVILGTLHTVFFLDGENSIFEDPEAAMLFPQIGEEISNNLEVFPERTNVNFAAASSRTEIALITYERGVGITSACGTGAAAWVAVGMSRGILDLAAPITVNLALGQLTVRKDTADNFCLSGPAVRAASGEFYLS
jgi:diaminopimelate epimerase